MMKIDILTLFPEMFKGPFDKSIIKRAVDNNLVKINIHNLRKWAKDKHKTVDDRPYGGGAGMIIRVDIIDRAISKLKTQNSKIILLSPQGKIFNQRKAQNLSKLDHLILICGHYEGFDERVRKLVDEEISIGDYVLTGGEIPAMVIVDSVVRLIPGVLKKREATKFESFSSLNSEFLTLNTPPAPRLRRAGKLLEYPQYTRPQKFKGLKVPEILLSGDHKEIEKWQKKQAILRTKKRRPELLKNF